VVSFVLAVLSWAFLFSSLIAFGVSLGVAAAVLGFLSLRGRGKVLGIAGAVIGGLCALAVPLLWVLRLVF
jgi:hypothetical protein